MFNSKTLAANIRKARLYRNYSQDYLAFKLGISQNGYSKIELGHTEVSVERLFIIASTLEMDPMKLISEPDISRDILSVTAIAIVPQLLEVICRSTGMGFAAVARVTDDRWVCCSVLDKMSFGMKTGDELKLETTLCNQIRQSGKAVVIDHVDTDAEYCGHPTPPMYGFQSYIAVPIIRRDGTFFGTLCSLDSRPARLDTPETIGMFELFAQLISFYLDVVEGTAFARQHDMDEERKKILHEQFTSIMGANLPHPIRTVLDVAL